MNGNDFFQTWVGGTPEEYQTHVLNTQQGFPTGQQNKEIAERATRESLETLGTAIKNARDSEVFKTVVDASLSSAENAADELAKTGNLITLPGNIPLPLKAVGMATGMAFFALGTSLMVAGGINNISEVAHKEAAQKKRPILDVYNDDFAVRDAYHKQMVLDMTSITMVGGLTALHVPIPFAVGATAVARVALDKNYDNIMTGIQNGLTDVRLIPAQAGIHFSVCVAG